MSKNPNTKWYYSNNNSDLFPFTNMFLNKIILLVIFTFSTYNLSLATDPDAVTDYCILEAESSSSSSPIQQCKNSSLVNVEDFVFSGIMDCGSLKKTGFSAYSVNSTVFPGLNTLGMSFVRADFDVGGVNVPHYHPRATEVAFVLEGEIYSGFVDTENRVLAKVIRAGEVMVFPKGLLHFQMNVGKRKATILGSFNSQSPGMVKIANAVFGSEIDEGLLKKAFGMDSKEIKRIRKRFNAEELD